MMLFILAIAFLRPDPCVLINEVKVPWLNEVIHLSHCLQEDVYKFNACQCVDNFNRRFNIFLISFKYTNSNIRDALFHKYCTLFYGSQILPVFNKCTPEVSSAWRVAMCRVWRVLW